MFYVSYMLIEEGNLCIEVSRITRRAMRLIMIARGREMKATEEEWRHSTYALPEQRP